MEELGNLATVLKFGMKLEGSIADFYRQLAEDERFSANKKTLTGFAEESEELKEDLNKRYVDCCRSDMDMGALEPVSGIVAENYLTDLEVSPATSPEKILKKAIEAEGKSSRFYADIGKSVDYLSTEEMEKIANRKEDRKRSLKEFSGRYESEK